MKKILVFGMTDNPGGIESVIMNYYRKIDREKIHANKYKYPDPYISDKVSLNIDCPFHGLFSMRPNNHLNGQRMS